MKKERKKRGRPPSAGPLNEQMTMRIPAELKKAIHECRRLREENPGFAQMVRDLLEEAIAADILRRKDSK